MNRQSKALTKDQSLPSKLQQVRGQLVILDADLADFYGVETRRLNEQVKRNKARFPADFVFPLKKQEVTDLMSQNAISRSHGGRRKPTYAFTEHGAVMASMILKTPKATKMSVHIVRTFVAMRNKLTQLAVNQIIQKIAPGYGPDGRKLIAGFTRKIK